jgi:hypothetical protein
MIAAQSMIRPTNNPNARKMPIMAGVALDHMRREVFKRFDEMRMLRNICILALAKRDNITSFDATIKFDLEYAPITSNHEMLAYANVILARPVDIANLKGDWSFHLNHLINALACINVYLINTNHLDDQALYTFLHDVVIHEEVRCLPPAPHVYEVVDLTGRSDAPAKRPPVCNRDATLPTPSSEETA